MMRAYDTALEISTLSTWRGYDYMAPPQRERERERERA